MILSCVSCAYIEKQLGFEEDNYIEEAVEFGIKMQTGLDIDLTPSSEEK